MIDLHCHSTVSDGMLSPAEVVRLAHQNGCTLLALTDHDHTGGIAEARAEADKLGLRFVNGVEISVTWRGRTIHVVGLDFDEQDENLQNLLAQVRQGRLKRLEAIADKLEKKGIGGAYDGAQEGGPRSPRGESEYPRRLGPARTVGPQPGLRYRNRPDPGPS